MLFKSLSVGDMRIVVNAETDSGTDKTRRS